MPPGATLWGLAVFLTDEPIELTVAIGQATQVIRGRFDGQRLSEYSWQNTSSWTQRVGIRAVALSGDRELPTAQARYRKWEHVYVAFGRRGTPEKPSDRHDGYPNEAMFVGFIVFDK